MAAMSVVMLTLGSLVEVLDLSMAAIASMLCIIAVIELGGAYPWMIYAVTSILSVILYPAGTACWFYLVFFGFYPIIKEKLERLHQTLAWALKILILNVAAVVYILVAYFIFYGGASAGSISDVFISIFGSSDAGLAFAIGMYAAVNVVFVVYDIALTRIISFYFARLRHRFKFFK
jgi:hypothetical protein